MELQDAGRSVGVGKDLTTTLRGLHQNDATEIESISYESNLLDIPQPTALQEMEQNWRQQTRDSGATLRNPSSPVQCRESPEAYMNCNFAWYRVLHYSMSRHDAERL